MSEFLAIDRRLEGEAPTVEGRLADIIAVPDCIVEVDEYKLSEPDKARLVRALRLVTERQLLHWTLRAVNACRSAGTRPETLLSETTWKNLGAPDWVLPAMCEKYGQLDESLALPNG